MYKLCILVLFLTITQDCLTQDEDEGPYRGKFIGKLNSYHHQVSGEVYAVDEWTLLLVNFNYDGTGEDSFFWAGDSGRPGPQGFIIPDQHGKTNILERYYNEDVRLSLPEGKRVSKLKWFSIYDLTSQNAFADVFVPDEFDPPAVRNLGGFGSTAVNSLPIKVLDANTIIIPEFNYDGSGQEVYFWTGVGPQPSSRGRIVPDEYGYLEPLRIYKNEDVSLELPGGLTVYDINWLAVYDVSTHESLGTVLVPEALNVPSASLETHAYKTSLPHCKQLHRDLQVSWEVFGNQITIQIAGLIDENEYMGFGISGASDKSKMLGADVAVCSYNKILQRGFATDYNITAEAPCVQVLGQWMGACRDDKLGALDSNQVFSATREDGLTTVTYRRQLQPTEAIDKEWKTEGPTYVVWAVGALDNEGEPAFHRLYHKADIKLELSKNPPENDCFPFTIGKRTTPAAWETVELFDPALRVFSCAVGDSGGAKGLRARRAAAPALAWYVNGHLAPDLQLRRGLQYTFKVFGGNDPHSPTEYHPLIITTEPEGGIERLTSAAQKSARPLAGVISTRRNTLAATAAGPLCISRHAPGADRRRDDQYATFRTYNRTLVNSCQPGAPALLNVSPNTSWPDIVYYHSFTHRGMGGRIFVVDRHKRNIGRRTTSFATRSHTSFSVTLIAFTSVVSFTLI